MRGNLAAVLTFGLAICVSACEPDSGTHTQAAESPEVWGSGNFDLKSDLELKEPLRVLGINLGIPPKAAIMSLKAHYPNGIPSVNTGELIAIQGQPPYKYISSVSYNLDSAVNESIGLSFSSPATKNQLISISRATLLKTETDWPKIEDVLRPYYSVLGEPTAKTTALPLFCYNDKNPAFRLEWHRKFGGMQPTIKKFRMGSADLPIYCSPNSPLDSNCDGVDYVVTVATCPAGDNQRTSKIVVWIANIYGWRLAAAADNQFVKQVRDEQLSKQGPGAYKQ
jgi:hypothetical protein